MPRMAYERRHTCEDRKSPPGKRIPPSFAVTATGFSVRPDFDFRLKEIESMAEQLMEGEAEAMVRAVVAKAKRGGHARRSTGATY